jgi:hypothetical protein
MFLVAEDVQRNLKNISEFKRIACVRTEILRNPSEDTLPGVKHLVKADRNTQGLVKLFSSLFFFVVEFRNLCDVSATESASFIS